MYWVDSGTGVTTPPTIPPVQSSVRQYFTEGGQGRQPTIPGGEWFNMVTDELLAVLAAASIEPNKSEHEQLKKALTKLFLSRLDPGGDIKNDKTAQKFFDNLGIKSAALRDVGIGANQIPDMNSFSSVLSIIGSEKAPGLTIKQWVGGNQPMIPAGGSKIITLPFPFPVGILVAIPFTGATAAGFGGMAGIRWIGRDQVIIFNSSMTQAIADYGVLIYGY